MVINFYIMATTNNSISNGEEMPLKTTGEPTEQYLPEEDENDFDLKNDSSDDDADFDNASIDDEDDLDDDEVKRLFPGENSYTESNGEAEPYEGVRHDDKEEGLVDDNMTGMPVVPSPS